VDQRTTRAIVTFQHPFTLGGVDEKLEAGEYIVETCEEMVEGLSFIAYKRISTTIIKPHAIYGEAIRQLFEIDPVELETALNCDSIKSAERCSQD
jgi:hypothetical protein